MFNQLLPVSMYASCPEDSLKIARSNSGHLACTGFCEQTMQAFNVH